MSLGASHAASLRLYVEKCLLVTGLPLPGDANETVLGKRGVSRGTGVATTVVGHTSVFLDHPRRVWLGPVGTVAGFTG